MSEELAEMARNRGLKLVKSRVRTPGKRRFGKAGLTDKAGKPVFGMDSGGPLATLADIENYLRNLGASDWGASLDVAVLPRKRKPSKISRQAPVNDRGPRPECKPVRKPKREPVLAIREAKSADAKGISQLLDYLGHPLGEKDVRRNLTALAKLKQLPLVATLDKDLVGLCGLSVMATVHRDAPVGRISTLVVSKEAQGKGIGRMLVAEAETRLKKAGCKILEVTSNDRRTAAHAFYRHLGYERTSLRFMKKL